MLPSGFPHSRQCATLLRLRAWRVARAAQEKVPAYVVFTDLTLQAIAEVKPADSKSKLRINGIGQSKLTKYADDLLALVRGETVEVGARDASDDGAEATLDEV